MAYSNFVRLGVVLLTLLGSLIAVAENASAQGAQPPSIHTVVTPDERVLSASQRQIMRTVRAGDGYITKNFIASFGTQCPLMKARLLGR